MLTIEVNYFFLQAGLGLIEKALIIASLNLLVILAAGFEPATLGI